MNVLIAGAGIGGLTLAAALQREGISARILERTHELKPVGAGITVQINGMRALSHYGFDAAVLASGAPCAETQLLDWKGRQLTSGSMAALSVRLGQPMLCVHRARLHEALRGLLSPGTLTLGCGVESYREENDAVVVTLDDGQLLRADLLVGCDGLHSKVRAQMLGESPTRYSGYTSWRGVCSTQGLPLSGALSQYWGPGARFGFVSIGFGELYWFATANASPGGRDGPQPDELLARYGTWHDPIPAVLRATPPDRIIRTDIVDRVPVTRWTSPRVALLGDAAHPMTPNLAQGACQAIEDAVVLARLLGLGGALPEVLHMYEVRRVERANGIVARAQRLGALGHWENALGRAVRDGAMRLFGARAGNAGLEELYGFTA